jgi:hypothetical protein
VLQSYQFNHTNPVNGENYYRLKMIDTEDSFTYSKIEQVKLYLGFEVLVYPNPVTESIHLQAPDWPKVRSVQILNNQGKRLYSSGEKPVQEVSVKVFKSGLHFFRLTFADGTEITRKLAVGQ